MNSKNNENRALKNTFQVPDPKVPASTASLENKNWEMQQSGHPHSLSLEVYQGSLDLLLHLIRSQEINIYDIPIAKITDQYLDYLRELENRDLGIEGEFLFMAATLIHIKSRMLLPTEPSPLEDKQEDPRAELVHRLLEHEKFKNAAQVLQMKRALEDATWSPSGISDFKEIDDDPGLAVDLFDLMSAFHGVIERAKRRQPIEIESGEVSVVSMMELIKGVLVRHERPVKLEELLIGLATRRSMITLFLGLLEMVRLRAIQLRQREALSPITVLKSKRFNDILEGVAVNWLQKELEENYR